MKIKWKKNNLNEINKRIKICEILQYIYNLFILLYIILSFLFNFNFKYNLP